MNGQATDLTTKGSGWKGKMSGKRTAPNPNSKMKGPGCNGGK